MSESTDQAVTGLPAAVQAAGGKKKHLAAKLGLSGAAITKWGDEIPIAWVIEVERATGVPRAVLRPDLFGQQEQVA